MFAQNLLPASTVVLAVFVQAVTLEQFGTNPLLAQVIIEGRGKGANEVYICRLIFEDWRLAWTSSVKAVDILPFIYITLSSKRNRVTFKKATHAVFEILFPHPHTI